MKTPNPPQKKLWFLLGLRLLTQQGFKMLEALLQMGRLRHNASWRWMFHFAGLWSCFETYSKNMTEVWLSLTCANFDTWNPKLFLGAGGWSRQLGQTRHDKIKHEDPQLASKTCVSAWSSALDPTRLKDVRGLAADGSSQTQGLLKMNVSLCWAVVVLWNLFNQNMTEVWLSLTCANFDTWNPKFFLGQVVGQDTLVRQDRTR